MILDAYGAPVNPTIPVGVACYGWQTPKPTPKPRYKQQLSNQNWDTLKALWEATDKQLQRQRWEDQEDFKNQEKRMGKGIWHTELVTRLLKLNKDLICEDSQAMKECASFYLVQNNVRTYTGACFRKGFLPEFTVMKTDRADLPTQDGLTYGWRTVLQRLVQKKAITYRQMLSVFGEVHYGDQRAKHWDRAIAPFRN
jgi:hypothetical protein